MDNITISYFASCLIIKRGLHLNILRCNPQSSYAKQPVFYNNSSKSPRFISTVIKPFASGFAIASLLFKSTLYFFSLEELSLLKPDQQ